MTGHAQQPPLDKYFTMNEATQVLEKRFGQPTTEAVVLRLCLGGYLKLSALLPKGTVADCQNLRDWEPIAIRDGEQCYLPDSDEARHDGPPPDDDDDQPPPFHPTGMSFDMAGLLWDVVMFGPGRVQVENRLRKVLGKPQIELEGPAGALVEIPGKTRCKLRGAFPAETEFVLRTSELLNFTMQSANRELLATLSIDEPVFTKSGSGSSPTELPPSHSVDKAPLPEGSEKGLSPKEWAKEAIIVAALLAVAKAVTAEKLDSLYKAAQFIESEVDKFRKQTDAQKAFDISPNTIYDHLKAMRKANPLVFKIAHPAMKLPNN